MAEQISKDLVPKLFKANLGVIEEEVLVNLPEDIRPLAVAASKALGDTSAVFFDEIPQDGSQVEGIWRDYVNEHLVDFATEKAKLEASKIKSVLIKNLTLLLVNPTSDSLKVLTDEITDDGTQLEQVWVNFLLEGTNLKVFLDNTLKPLVLITLKSETLATTLVAIAESEIKRLLNERT